MMNEVNPLVWPSPNGIGILDAGLWQQTVDVSIEAGIITGPPPADAYRTDLAEAALERLADQDTTGTSFQKGTVTVTEGGN
jgi:NitT/TauT family transport system substrate-binding protein